MRIYLDSDGEPVRQPGVKEAERFRFVPVEVIPADEEELARAIRGALSEEGWHAQQFDADSARRVARRVRAALERRPR